MTWNRYYQGIAEALQVAPPRLVHIPTDLLAQVVPQQARRCLESFQFNKIFDNTAAKRDLHFRYTVPWVEGARRTITWLEAQGRLANSDEDLFEDRLISAWERLGREMGLDLAKLNIA